LTKPILALDSLIGWKAIARFLGRDTRTVQLWERERGLPIHRLPGHASQSVHAYPHELAKWLSGSRQMHGPAPAQTKVRAPGLLVLPFRFHDHGSVNAAAVGDTLAQELLHRLTVAPPCKVRVLSWTTSCSYKGAARRADEIAIASDVRYLVEGAIQKKGSRWCIDIRLVDALDDRVEFADRFEAIGPDIFALQSTIAEAVSGQLALHISGRLVEPFWDQPVSPQAFHSYVAAAYGATRPNTRDLRAALDHANEACTLDSSFMPAQILRASLQIQVLSYAGASVTEGLAKDVARQCVRDAPRLATSKALDATLAAVLENDWERSDLRYGEITSALPANLEARLGFASNLALRGRFTDAQKVIDDAAAIERPPQVLQAQAYLHIWQGNFEAAALLQDEILTHSGFQYPTTIMQAMVVGMMLRDDTRMHALLEKIEPELSPVYRNCLAMCAAASTRDAGALMTARKQLTAAAECGEALWYHVALLDGYVGDAKNAVLHLRRAIDLRENGINNAAVAPGFAPVRDDPQFRSQLSRLNLV
jgi:TolB-like protein